MLHPWVHIPIGHHIVAITIISNSEDNNLFKFAYVIAISNLFDLLE